MSVIQRLRRRFSGASGPPADLRSGELAYNEVEDVLYYGKGLIAGDKATSAIPIGGPGSTPSQYVSRLGMFSGVTSTIIGTLRYYPATPCTITKLNAWCAADPPSNTTVTLRKNGSVLGSVIIPMGSTIATPLVLNVTLLTTDYLTLDLVSTGAYDVVSRIDF